jgi:GNAT superfamily N-acetyltransferase
MTRIIRADSSHLRLYSEHLKALPEHDNISRFGIRASNYSIDQLILNILYRPDDHILWVAREGSHPLGWGHLARDGNDWELAVSVNHDQQNKGIGSQLIGEMLEWAKVHEVREVYMNCIESNKTIQHLAGKHNLKTRTRGAGERTAAIAIPTPSPVDVNSQKWKEHMKIMEEYTHLRQRLTSLWVDWPR